MCNLIIQGEHNGGLCSQIFAHGEVNYTYFHTPALDLRITLTRLAVSGLSTAIKSVV